ncbi:MAG: hypothetical protein AAB542_04610 [Patescibacteria group bacterium]
MNLGKLSYYSRKIHNWSLWFVVGTGLIQVSTGIIMRHPALFPLVDYGAIRFLHFQTATYFSVAFAAQMITGLVMFVTPWILKHLHKTPLQP